MIKTFNLPKMNASKWKSIPCKISELRLDRTLACGQSFRWKEHTSGVWTGVIGDSVWKMTQSDTQLFYQVYRNPSHSLKQQEVKVRCDKAVKRKDKQTDKKEKQIKLEDSDKKMDIMSHVVKTEPKLENTDCHNNVMNPAFSGSDEIILKDYLQLDINLENLYKTWANADKNFDMVSKQFTGIRILRQHPVECLFSFICSSNNNISRITSMVNKLSTNYGKKLLELDGEEYYTFPQVSALSVNGVEEQLRSLGFGYRAKYIQTSARYIQENGGEDWLLALREMKYEDAKAHLVKLCGVGAKVADCVGLFCLDKPGAIPVDTHVWQIAARDYMPKLKQAKSVTDKLYQEIGDHFRCLWGPYAGWAHSVLFTADLRQFKGTDEKSPDKKTNTKRKNGNTAAQTSTKRRKK